MKQQVKYLAKNQILTFCGTIPEWLDIMQKRLSEINRYKYEQDELSTIDRSIIGMTPWQAFKFCKDCGLIKTVKCYTVNYNNKQSRD